MLRPLLLVTSLLLLLGAFGPVAVAPAALSPAPLAAQGVEGSLRGLALENAELYVAPLVDGLGRALGASHVESARALRPLRFHVGVRVLSSFPSDEARSFAPVLPDSIVHQGRVFHDPYGSMGGSAVSPTAVARGEGVRLGPQGEFRQELEATGQDPDDFIIRFPDGLNIPAVPFALIQGSLGVGMGTEVTGRFVPKVRMDDDLGDLRATGVAVKHSVTHWLDLPVDVAVEGGLLNFEAGRYLDARANHYGLAVSGTRGILTLFGAAGRQSASMDIRYEVENPEGIPGMPDDGTEITFDRKVDSETRVSVGALARFYVVTLSAHYSLAEFHGASVMLGIGLP